MDLFNSLPLKKQEYMNRLFRNCTEEVKYYMSVIDVEADQTFIKAGEECKYIYIILSGKEPESNGRCMRNLISLRTLDQVTSLVRLNVLPDFQDTGSAFCLQQNAGCLPFHLFIIWSGCIWMLMHCS